MKKKFLLFLSIIFCIVCSFELTGASKTTAKDKSFFSDLDKFDSKDFVMADWTNGGMFNCGWKPDHITFADGKMTLHLDNTPSHDHDYSGAEYRTSKKYSYGTYTVRMKPAKQNGIVSSFFTWTESKDEIDIEFLGKDTNKVQFNYFVKGVGGHEKIVNLGFDASKDFHEYSFTWTPTSIEWFVDNKSVYSVKNVELPTDPQIIMMNLWNGITVDSWLKPFVYKNEITATYDYIKYEPLPAETK